MLAHVAAAKLHAVELSSIAAAENCEMRAIGGALQSILGAVTELQAAGRSNASAAAVERVHETLEDLTARITAAAAVLGGTDPAAAPGRVDRLRLTASVPPVLAITAAGDSAAAATMSMGAKPFITLEALGTVGRLVDEWTVGIGATALIEYDTNQKLRKPAADNAGMSSKVSALRAAAARTRVRALCCCETLMLAFFPPSCFARSFRNAARYSRRWKRCGKTRARLTGRRPSLPCNCRQTRLARSGSCSMRSAAATTPAPAPQRQTPRAPMARRSETRSLWNKTKETEPC